jgi:biopolymer transport protein ExbD
VGDAPKIQERKPVIIAITRDSRVLWAGELITPGDLPRLVAGAIASSDDILIAGDDSAPYGAVAGLLCDLQGLGVVSVGLVFDGEKTSQ